MIIIIILFNFIIIFINIIIITIIIIIIIKVVLLLLGRKADLNIKDRLGRSPLSFAISNNHDNIIKLFNDYNNNNNNQMQICVICQVNPRNVLFRPCKHLCVCNECDQFMKNSNSISTTFCPICRTIIEDTERLYIP